MIGKTLGHYEITDKLGQGGMGSVWLAQDAKLGRKVAIKTLPEEFAGDEERLARFEREAKLLASLNHPNIATIHGLEEHNGTRFLVLELVEGDTLADRLKRGAIPVEESLKLALQIAEALEAAHEKGVIHRDLKPANIKVTPDGKVKVLDFGLAKAFAGDGSDVNLSQSPTLSMAATQQGVILGTAAYMSPEQARGLSVDKRADIWAFGCVLYEMLTGRQVFQGELMSDVMASVLKSDPDYKGLPPTIHPQLRAVLRRCLEKEPKQRWHDVGDVRVELEQVATDPEGTLVQPVAEALAPQLKLPWVAAAFVMGVMLTAGASFWILVQPVPPPPVRRVQLTLPATQTLQGSVGTLVAISPNGNTLVYRAVEDAVSRLYRRDLDQFDATPIPGTEGSSQTPFFSADGKWLAFQMGVSTLMKVELDGGPPVEVGKLPGSLRAGSWTSDDTIIAAANDAGLVRVPGGGGNPEIIASSEDGRAYWYPQVLPGNRAVLFTANAFSAADADAVMLFDLESEETRLLVQDAVAGQYLPTGHLVFAREGNIWATGFDLDRLEVVGDPVLIDQGVRIESGDMVQMAVAADGTLVYVPSGSATQRTLALVNREDGAVEELGVPPRKLHASPRLSGWTTLSGDDPRRRRLRVMGPRPLRPHGTSPVDV